MSIVPSIRAFSRRGAPLTLRALRTNSFTRLSSTSSYDNIKVTSPSPSVKLITLHRPEVYNALSSPLFKELNAALSAIADDPQVGAVVLTGSEKAFAAGADIKEMKDRTLAEAYGGDFLDGWSKVGTVGKPIIAAVSGYALGGGCELAMMCDIILASPTATFGQPEVNLGIIPGGGGTQRLTHAVGKSRAMEIILTGRNFSAREASDWGLISRVVEGEGDAVVQEAIKVAEKIATKGRLSIKAAKEAVNSAYELPLQHGLHWERRLFHMLFGTHDQKEGMGAFAEKRKANFTHS